MFENRNVPIKNNQLEGKQQLAIYEGFGINLTYSKKEIDITDIWTICSNMFLNKKC